jgi:hypothetical protein
MPIDPAPALDAAPALPPAPLEIDERAARLSQAVTGLLVLAALLARAPALLVLPALHLAVSLALGPRGNGVLRVFDLAIAPRLRTRRPEDPRPLRFANAVGAALLFAALLLHAGGLAIAAWSVAAAIAALSLLAAATGFCVGCRFYGLLAALRRAR